MSNILSEYINVEFSNCWNVSNSIFKLLNDKGEFNPKEFISSCTFINNTFYLALAQGSRYIILSHSQNSSSQDLTLVSMNLDGSREKISSIKCMGIYSSSAFKKREMDQLLIFVGYETGRLVIFSKEGLSLLSQKLHNTELFRIQVYFDHKNYYKQAKKHLKKNSALTLSDNKNLTDVTNISGFYDINLCFRDGVIIIIDSQSLWLSLQLSIKNSEMYNLSDSENDLFFSFKKIDLKTSPIQDAVSCGTYSVMPEQLSSLNDKITSSNLISQSVTNSFLVVHSKSMIDIFTTTETINYSFSALKFANRVASKVGGAVFSLAKSYLWASHSQNLSDDVNQQNLRPSSPIIAPDSISINSSLNINDGNRKIIKIFPAPPHYHMAALLDSFGRILVLDTITYEIIMIWKGFREAQCDWIDYSSDITDLPNSSENSQNIQNTAQNVLLFLVLYASRLGVLQVYSILMPNKPIATFQIGRGYQLISSNSHSLGEPLLAELNLSSNKLISNQGKRSILMDSNGRIFKLEIKQNL
ncbi:hypothetical protein BB561_002826 [Smittium simulii]|uniref:Rab3-GAP regulatory subunit N-terminal domain-containing protein n=1 Tax=Smittium simulii TaxID=133385 RepID=A0A2T9YP07_9FUNG|nr:hypothetical protein BB561_002826 [Smittium simulii]